MCARDDQASARIIRLKPRLAGLRLLSLDGGGVRGIIEILILKAIHERVGLPKLAFHELFDLVVGTSTGNLSNHQPLKERYTLT